MVHRRSPVSPARSATMIAATEIRSDAEYTSVSVAFCQTVLIAPAVIAAAMPASGARVERAIHSAVSPAAAAAQTADNKFVAVAKGRNHSSRAHALSATMKSGV